MLKRFWAIFSVGAPEYCGVNRPDVTALFIIYLILLAGSSRDDHINQSKRQVMCYHRNKDDFLI